VKLLKKQKLAAQISTLISIITIAGMLVLWGIVEHNASSTVKTNITNQMTDAVKSRAAIINNYVISAEEYMSAFALSSEVRDLLRDPENPELVEQAQQYTEDFAAVKGIFEGLYVATPDTHVLTHTSAEAIGMVTRQGDSLKEFRNTILAQPELTNLGIMKSPGTGAMILSMYCPVFENQQCIGYVGAGVYAGNLMDSLLELDIQGLPNSEYVFINAETGVYLYHRDEALLNTETADPGYLEIMQRVQSGKTSQQGTYTYRDENGTKQFVVYQYLADRNWIFMVRDNISEVYREVVDVRIKVGLICAAVTTLIILCLIGMMRRIGQRLVTVERAIGRLGCLELETDQELSLLYGRNDEIGSIARTTQALCERLRLTIDDIGRILGEMADGNIAVDVDCGESYYIGDFQVLAKSLKTIRTKLLRLTRNIAQVSNSVTDEADQVSQNAVSLLQGIMTQESSVTRLTDNADDIVVQIRSNTDNCSSAQELADQAAMHMAEADQKMARMTSAMDNIAHSSAEIEKITCVIEDIAFQTNILALNASIEATQAGAAGKGFAVVADRVRALAAKSAEAAKDTADLINRSLQDIHVGMEATAQAAEIMHIIGECTGSIKEQMHGIADASMRQSDMITSVGKEIEEISVVVQNNSAAVNQSTDAIQNLSEQAKELNQLVGQFQTGC
jgi:Methyl-accepting chemotaxis protein